VVGIDLSERMLLLATAERAHPRVTYQRAAIEGVTFLPESFDLVVSSLTLHYVQHYEALGAV
jgi:2-polyprenyl-3-methyl-5-hydroxy-6-metoxy-1,4-benzoquinol methylase